ncbi:hypothetical protein V6N13_053810 [Hibiscus sabdariffa]
MSTSKIVNWKRLFVGAEAQSLNFFPPAICDGIPVVHPPQSVFEDGVSEWRYALVGQFIGIPPSFSSMQKIVEVLWGKNSTVKEMGAKYEAT